MMDDALADGALDLLKTQVQKEVMDITGMMPGLEGGPAMPLDPTMAMSADGDILGDGLLGAQGMDYGASMAALEGEANIRNELVTKAYGTKIPQKRKPGSDDRNTQTG